MTQRIQTWDLLKLFAIVLVVWGHCIEDFQNVTNWTQLVYRYIYAFHMPLFMTISGFFGARYIYRRWHVLLANKVVQLLIPLAVFCLLGYLSESLLQVMGVCKIFRGGDYFIANACWFVRSLFACILIYYLFAVPFSKIPKFMLISLGISLVISQFFQIWKIDYMYPCFLFGVALYNKQAWIKRHNTLLLISSWILFLAMMLSWDERFWHIQGASSLNELFNDKTCLYEYVYRKFYKLVIGGAGTLAIITCFQRFIVSDHKEGKIAELGQHTLGVYLIQGVVLEIFFRNFIKYDEAGFFAFNFVLTPLWAVAVLFICYSLIKHIRKSKVVSLLLLGEGDMKDKVQIQIVEWIDSLPFICGRKHITD